MSQQVGQQLAAAGLEENKAYVVGRLGVKGLQLGCLAATPIYAIQSIRKGGFSLRGLLRYNWFVPVLGAGAGATAGFIQTSQMDHPTLAFKATDFRMDADRVRQDDMHLIGSVIGALVLPALFRE
ncbi:hypothetical protein IE53DRAFT_13380 [Violaceomyces palustris]|uniref:Uncharacterized protein n=1 Tax=Violaceomyces palustris TaxID=1673888 RepID=A0ACD0P2E8_9BASI|nr:hypothetical protein IE53DRAFT_13380 [Violaceomyces palustris]